MQDIGPDHASAIDSASAAAPAVVVYIDKQRLGRNCVGERLASYLPGSLIEAVESIREVQADGNRSGASVVILHARSASLRSAEITEEIAAIGTMVPGVPLVVMSDLPDVAEVHMAMELGARGFLPADLSLPQAVAAIRFVGSGGTYIPPCVLAASRGMQPISSTGPRDSSGRLIQFTARQLDVLERLKQGQPNKIIAYELGMCESTVKVHIRNIMKKLKARNRTQVLLLTFNTTNRPVETDAA
jgi:DNA-binding NarL/FixJ family response regulator